MKKIWQVKFSLLKMIDGNCFTGKNYQSILCWAWGKLELAYTTISTDHYIPYFSPQMPKNIWVVQLEWKDSGEKQFYLCIQTQKIIHRVHCTYCMCSLVCKQYIKVLWMAWMLGHHAAPMNWEQGGWNGHSDSQKMYKLTSNLLWDPYTSTHISVIATLKLSG